MGSNRHSLPIKAAARFVFKTENKICESQVHKLRYSEIKRLGREICIRLIFFWRLSYMGTQNLTLPLHMKVSVARIVQGSNTRAAGSGADPPAARQAQRSPAAPGTSRPTPGGDAAPRPAPASPQKDQRPPSQPQSLCEALENQGTRGAVPAPHLAATEGLQTPSVTLNAGCISNLIYLYQRLQKIHLMSHFPVTVNGN